MVTIMVTILSVAVAPSRMVPLRGLLVCVILKSSVISQKGTFGVKATHRSITLTVTVFMSIVMVGSISRLLRWKRMMTMVMMNRLIRSLIGRLVDMLMGKVMSRMISRVLNRLVGRLMNRLMSRPMSILTVVIALRVVWRSTMSAAIPKDSR